jgi:DNA-directed RNA polymerase subunit RPC12/RpoP
MYKCLQCGKEVSNLVAGAIRCPACGSKIFSKMRDSILKNVKAV